MVKFDPTKAKLTLRVVVVVVVGWLNLHMHIV